MRKNETDKTGLLEALISAKSRPVLSVFAAIALTFSLTGIFLTVEAAQAAKPMVVVYSNEKVNAVEIPYEEEESPTVQEDYWE